MTFTDMIEHSSKLFHSFSMNNNLNKKDQHGKLHRRNTSILKIFPRHRQTNNSEKKTTNQQTEQQRNYFLQPPSIMTTSELSRSISNKSITFATVFDELENENTNHTTFDFDTLENKDLVIVVPDKYVDNEFTVNNSNIEPYPFRSEIPSCSLPKSHSTTNMTNSSHSTKKSFHHLIHHHHRPKKLRHPIKPIQSVKPIDRSKSAPNLLFSLSSTPNSTINDHHRPLKTFRQWFKSSSFGRFVQSFIKHPNGNTNIPNTKHLKQKSRVKPTPSRKYSDLIY